jgi:hypothetical protein
MKKFICIYACFLITTSIFAQRTLGSWQDYLSFANATKVAIAGEKIYCMTDGGLFFYNTSDNSINKLTLLNGLSDSGIKTIAYNQENKVLVIAYKNSNVDLVFESGIINISDIRRKQMIADKSINSIMFYGKTAYLSCGFGIVAINLEKKEIKDTYIIGPGGTEIKINDMETDGQRLYAATDQGIFSAAINDPNLLDYRTWSRIESIMRPSGKYSHLALHAGTIIAAFTSGEYDTNELYQQKNGKWERYLSEINYINDMQVYGGYLTVVSHGNIYIVDTNHTLQGRVNQYLIKSKSVTDINPRSAIFSSSSGLWIADYTYSLVKVASNIAEAIVPIGPANNNVFSLLIAGNKLLVAPGGHTDSWSNSWIPASFHSLNEGTWQYYSNSQYPRLKKFFDITCFAVSPSDPDHFFAGSWGGGIFEFQGATLVKQYSNPYLKSASGVTSDPDSLFVRIGGLCFDNEENLWITNSETPTVLVKRSKSGEWKNYELPEIANKYSIGQILVTQTGDKWIVVPRGNNIFVTNKDVSKKIVLPVIARFSQNNTIVKLTEMNDVYSIAEDQAGGIWVGTSNGLAYYSDPSVIWGDEPFASQPDLNSDDGIFNPFLENETVTAIAVDGANRKWLGTKNSGIYLINDLENSDDGANRKWLGTKNSGIYLINDLENSEILHFTRENSPLLSNTITAIALAKNGEVFIGTPEGLISYQGDANQGSSDFKDILVYPNPVRETYSGPVIIKGLMENTDIRITDIAGNLVFKGKSLGGMASWDGKNLNGHRVKTGVYLIFCSDMLGTKTRIEKLLFIH